jgi:hypothetical protein
VEIFREGTAQGYATLPKPVKLGCIVSVAMPNLNSKVRDAPVEKIGNKATYRARIRKRWRAVLNAAFSAGATDIVCPDAGCGIYGNDPAIIGSTLGEVLRAEFWGHIKNLWVVGSDEFFTAVETGIASAKPESNFGKLKGKLLERMGGDSRRSMKSDAESDAASCHSDCESKGTPSHASDGHRIGRQASANPRSPWGAKFKWKRNNSTSNSTTASSVDSDEISSSADTTNPISSAGDGSCLNHTVVQSGSMLTDEALRCHLESLLKTDSSGNQTLLKCSVPDDTPESQVQSPKAALKCSGGLVPMELQAAQGCEEMTCIQVAGLQMHVSDGYTTHETIQAAGDATVLRKEFARLSLASDAVIVTM